MHFLEDTIRRRDIYKLPLNNYRIIPNISNVVDDLLKSSLIIAIDTCI